MVGFMTPFACVVATLGYIFDGVVLFLSASPRWSCLAPAHFRLTRGFSAAAK
jgi:hypothetical protein